MVLIQSCYLLLSINTSEDYFGTVVLCSALLMPLYLKGDNSQAFTDWI